MAAARAVESVFGLKMSETPDWAPVRGQNKYSVYRVTCGFCPFALRNTPKRQAIHVTEFCAAMQRDEISGHPLHKRCVSA
jgi:hypothetical protein